MTTFEESTTLDFIQHNLLADFASADAFIASLDFGLSHLQNYQFPELYQLLSPKPDPNHQLHEIFSYDIKPEAVDMDTPTSFISESKMESKVSLSEERRHYRGAYDRAAFKMRGHKAILNFPLEASPPASTGRKRGKEKRIQSPGSDVMSRVSGEVALEMKEGDVKPA
ncbi:hypothetical protein F3Y22_tig00110788pilonHSYRG00248 [Hibiscus syriacus]|uniref:AP2/ERF domain-containing protein n=1 Tax=Hibiscus syriacus TaxID=106335 RepID=A0A6A2ZQY7_HIBSY|nr:hypothetical protein F3Y22_tig00110788pilonHSYRG00248 [Hibiscus syriacus]